MATRAFSRAAALACLLALGPLAGGCGGDGGGGDRAKRPTRSASRPIAKRPPAAAPAFRPLAVPADAPRHSVRVPILMYHRVHELATELTRSQPELTVEPAEFRRQMRALLRAGYRTITQRQLFDAVYRAAALPRRPVIVSVDDGYVDDVTEILPVLRRLRMVATFYVITGRTHEAGFLSARQIRSLERAGMDVGAHTRTHPDLPSLAAEGLRAEVSGSARDLRRILGHPVYWFAYPAGAFDERTIGAVRRAGFLMAVTTQPGSSVSSTAPFAIPRLRVNRSTGVRGVLDLVRDG